MNNEVMKKLGWFMVRLGIAYLSIGVLLGVVILNNTYAPRFFSMDWDIMAWFAVLVTILSYVLFRIKRTTNIGKLMFASILGTVVLFMYAEERYWIANINVRSWSLFLSVLYVSMLLYFLFPHRWLKPFLFLSPVAAGSWVLFWVGYTPINVTLSIMEVQGTIPDEKYHKAISMLPEVYSACLISALLWTSQILGVYALAYWGNNPRVSYQNAVRSVRSIVSPSK
ncbi:hypothetical protein [Vibrio coralliirubri]|uniref:hypothetical protein n=1 Tax=Vibrio coralliirubri TaxID=1516159 RepID=UPI001E3BEFDC|nr:hypothetical protein [Vibrio coralliirubri]